MTDNLKERARELLAAELARSDDKDGARRVRDGQTHDLLMASQALRAIEAALSLPTVSVEARNAVTPIMLEIAAADDAHFMWERRWEQLKQMYERQRCFVDRDGEWGLRCFLDYVGEACGFGLPTPPEKPL